MGNCLVLENKVIKIVKNDGKILEYREPMKVHQILNQFSDYRLFDNVSNTQHLNPQTKLLYNRLYYLVPVSMEKSNPKKKKTIKKVRFADPEINQNEGLRKDYNGKEENDKVMRVKIVLSKQELKKLLEGGSVQEMIYHTLDKQDLFLSNDLDSNTKGCKPLLDSIPELE